MSPEPRTSDELVVLSHLGWDWVWQRPQHLVSRLAARRRRTWFVEEPLPGDVPEPMLREERDGDVTRLWLEVPGSGGWIGFDGVAPGLYLDRLTERIGWSAGRTAWLYTPAALDIALGLGPSLLVYDVMDDLASFAKAPEGLVTRQRRALAEADVVFTGGRSLHAGVTAIRPAGTHLFPSGVEPEHYAGAVEERRRRRAASASGPPVAGYVGVVDERLDLDLLAGLAAALPDWEVRVVGPVAKIDEATLPVAPNLRYAGPRRYAELPSVMAGFDVALMPFALNEATRSISPTKTLEYLAAGLPVVSTRVPDVVADHGRVVDLQDDAAGFAGACRRVLAHDAEERADRARPLLHWHHWDSIAARMDRLMTAAGTSRDIREETA